MCARVRCSIVICISSCQQINVPGCLDGYWDVRYLPRLTSCIRYRQSTRDFDAVMQQWNLSDFLLHVDRDRGTCETHWYGHHEECCITMHIHVFVDCFLCLAVSVARTLALSPSLPFRLTFALLWHLFLAYANNATDIRNGLFACCVYTNQMQYVRIECEAKWRKRIVCAEVL